MTPDRGQTGRAAGELPPGRPADLANLIAYQDGAVVSRVLLRRGGGSVTLFAFDVGQELSEHTTPFDALVAVLDGAMDASIGGQSVHVEQGETVLFPANVPHAVTATGRFRMLLTMIRDHVGTERTQE